MKKIILACFAASANQQATDYLANCDAISTRLAGHGINVPRCPAVLSDTAP